MNASRSKHADQRAHPWTSPAEECSHWDEPDRRHEATVTTPLTDDELVLRPVELSAAQATQLRLYASRNGREMPISQYEGDRYSDEGLEPPVA